ncbi:kinase-like domain-containing protein [Rhizophagus clarus]|uniref:Kinase-like domain-containing protein n=1 Tax=Rhizophagus clarus TaxID=94130 RepID=A0A8H3M3U0_9GLOM|nr:kinase-like domain-containing protein [Rhizophagus clarus]
MYSLFGTSGNKIIDQFITDNKGLNWVPYNKFNNIEYLDKGGFSTLYKATYEDYGVVLKYLNYLNINNSDESLNEFLNELKRYKEYLKKYEFICLYGFTKDPNTLDYIIIMDYANKGNLRGCLTEIIENNWKQRLYILYKIISGLNRIHKKGLIHHNLHDGNILLHKYEKNKNDKVWISDLGLCQTAKSDEIYGVIPFMAPEILRGQPYTPASDIYSFSIIMWEFTSGILPFNNRAHDLQLSSSICKGERLEIIDNIPQCYIDLMTKCWNEDPLKRPSASEVLNIINKWIFNNAQTNEELKNIMEFINAPIHHNNFITEPHPQAYYKSRLLDFIGRKLKGSQELKDSEKEDVEQKIFKSEMEIEAKRKELNKMHLAYQDIQMQLANFQQKNFQFEQDYQNLRLDLDEKNKQFAEKESTLQILLIEKQVLENNFNQLNQEKNNLQNQLTEKETNIQELKTQQDQYKNQLIQLQLNHKQKEDENLKLENQLKEKQIELAALQQKNSQFKQDIQNLNLGLAMKTKEFAEKENILQAQIALTTNLTKQLEQSQIQIDQLNQEKNNLQDQIPINQQIQIEINKLKKEKNDLQNKLAQTETSIQELKTQQESLIKQKEQLEKELNQSQIDCRQMGQDKIDMQIMLTGLAQDQKFADKSKARLKNEIAQLEQKLITVEQDLLSEQQTKTQLTKALHIIENKMNELDQKLISLVDKKKESTSEEDANKEIYEENEDKVIIDLDEYDIDDGNKYIFDQVINFLKAKSNFLTLQDEAIEKLQVCYNRLEQNEVIDDGVATVGKVIPVIENAISIIDNMASPMENKIANIKFDDRYTKEFQNILVKYDGLLQLDKDYYSLMNIIQKNKDLMEVIENILKLNSFNFDKYKIFKLATNSQEGTRTQLNSNMMADDINSLKKNLNELKLELNQEKEELKEKLAVD